MSCFEPPYREPPEGEWRCPACPPIGSEPANDDVLPEEIPGVGDYPLPESLRESSVASTSHHVPPSSDAPEPSDPTLTTDASEAEIDVIGVPTPRRGTRDRKSKKGRQVARGEEEEEGEAEDGPSEVVEVVGVVDVLGEATESVDAAVSVPVADGDDMGVERKREDGG